MDESEQSVDIKVLEEEKKEQEKEGNINTEQSARKIKL